MAFSYQSECLQKKNIPISLHTLAGYSTVTVKVSILQILLDLRFHYNFKLNFNVKNNAMKISSLEFPYFFKEQTKSLHTSAEIINQNKENINTGKRWPLLTGY